MNPISAINCPFCHSTRKVLYLYSTDTYWCAKCKKYGSTTELTPELLTDITINTPKETKTTKYLYNNSGERFSVCKARHYSNKTDTFQIKLPDGSLVGHYSRMPNKVSNIEGIKGFCYREEYLNLATVYRLVEGLYDCIYPNDVAVLGYPNVFQAKQLYWYNLILCPDGDVWQSLDNLYRWLKPFWNHKRCVLEYIPNGLDPDQCPSDKRKTVALSEVKLYLKGKSYG